MRNINGDLTQLKQEVLCNPPSAALPSNLSVRWLDVALQDVERAIRADGESDSAYLRIPLTLVLHLLSSKTGADSLEISDEQLFRYIRTYRLELAMEKLRRWGVQLTLPATLATIFEEDEASLP